jgi:hypothetical protein
MISALLRNVEDGKVVALAALVLMLAPLAAAVVFAVALVLALRAGAGLLVVASLALVILAVTVFVVARRETLMPAGRHN